MKRLRTSSPPLNCIIFINIYYIMSLHYQYTWYTYTFLNTCIMLRILYQKIMNIFDFKMYRKKYRNFKSFMVCLFSIFTPTHLVTCHPRFIA